MPVLEKPVIPRVDEDELLVTLATKPPMSSVLLSRALMPDADDEQGALIGVVNALMKLRKSGLAVWTREGWTATSKGVLFASAMLTAR